MKSIDLVTIRDPKSPIAEVYKSLRTNIRFKSFKKNIKTIVITSTGPDEGKSTIVSNLGVAMAQARSRVVILDGDLRNPTVHQNFLLSNTVGLTNILVDDTPFIDVILKSDIENLDIISSGPKPPNPAELLNSEMMNKLLEDLKNVYDYILIDTPPAAMVTDAALLASAADGTIIVASSGETIIEGIVRTRELLKSVGANLLGVVLNKAKVDKSKGYYYKYHSSYYGKANTIKIGRGNVMRGDTTNV
jgi:capsular exopolysaccharide synthesis family protein